MPAISRTMLKQALQARQWDRRNMPNFHGGRPDVSPNAFAFLVPVIVVFFFAPFACIYFVRRRRQPPPRVVLQMKQPAVGRAEARKMLESVTEIASATRDVKATGHHETIEERSEVDSDSMLEKDCAICLSTLHVPSSPEPAKLSHEATTVQITMKTPPAKSLSTNEEQTLRLKVCGHQFHTECLVSWCAIRKTSCPICRATYYVDEAKQASAVETQVPATPLIPASLSHFVHTGQTTMTPQARGDRASSRWQFWTCRRQ